MNRVFIVYESYYNHEGTWETVIDIYASADDAQKASDDLNVKNDDSHVAYYVLFHDVIKDSNAN